MTTKAKDFSVTVWVQLRNRDGNVVNTFTDKAPIVRVDDQGREIVEYYGERTIHDNNQIDLPVDDMRA